MADETGISFPDGGMCASDSGMSVHSCTKRDHHYLHKENKELRARNAALEAEVVRLKKVRRNHDRLITELKDKLACILEASDED